MTDTNLWKPYFIYSTKTNLFDEKPHFLPQMLQKHDKRQFYILKKGQIIFSK